MLRFLEHLGQIAVSSGAWFRACVSSRHYPHITIEHGISIILEHQEGHDNDIADYLKGELKIGHTNLAIEIRNEILKRASGIFLWVVLVVQLLNKDHDRGNIHALKRRLQGIPDGLEDLFNDILSRDGEYEQDRILCLQWVLFAKRPLKPEELYYAILAEVEPDFVSAWDPEEVTKDDMKRFILDRSKGLVEETKGETKTVQFIHESVRDFFLKGTGLEKLRLGTTRAFLSQSHDRLKQCCQRYYTAPMIREQLGFEKSLLQALLEEATQLCKSGHEKFPFLVYAVRNVLYHSDAAHGPTCPQEHFVKIFDLSRWIYLSNLTKKYKAHYHSTHTDLLYILAEQGLPRLIRIELERVSNMDTRGGRYGLPLVTAQAAGNGDALRALLRSELCENAYDFGVTHEESCAACYGMQEALLSLRDIDSTHIGIKPDGTPLVWALKYEHFTLARLLILTKKVDLNVRDGNGRTPLAWAALQGAEGVVRLLLDTGKVDLDARDNGYRTPLSWAASQGREEICRLLLETGNVYPEARDKYGCTPLIWAASQGREGIVRLLLDTGKVDPEARENDDRTSLSWAARARAEEPVKLLLGTGKVNPDTRDSYGLTPLCWAALRGKGGIVRLLLETDRVNPDTRDTYGRTPLSWAAGAGAEEPVKLLLGTGKVDPDSRDRYGRTPLIWAAGAGAEGPVKLLLRTGKVDPDSRDKYGRTPLNWAAGVGAERPVKLLLETGKVDPEARDNYDNSPLSLAVWDGAEGIVKLFRSYLSNQPKVATRLRSTKLVQARSGK